MEAWGSWKFSRENENLLAEVLKKCATDQCNLDKPIKDVLSSLAALSKTRSEFACSSSSDDSDIDGDFDAVLTRSLRFHTATVTENDDKPATVVVDDDVIPALDTFYGESSFLSQPQPAVNAIDGNSTKLIVELLNSGNYDVRELCSLLKTERRNRKDELDIIRDVWSEITTDKARHGLCEVLIESDVKPNVICIHVYLPWFKTCESNLTGFIESLSKLIAHFPDYACKHFLVELLKDKESILVKHVDWLMEIMKSLDQQHWCSLLSEYVNYCSDNLYHHEIPVLSHLVKNCQKSLNDHTTERLVVLCRNAVHVHSANTDFATFLVTVIGAIDLAKFRPEMVLICGQLKGASKFLIAKALKDVK